MLKEAAEGRDTLGVAIGTLKMLHAFMGKSCPGSKNCCFRFCDHCETARECGGVKRIIGLCCECYNAKDSHILTNVSNREQQAVFEESCLQRWSCRRMGREAQGREVCKMGSNWASGTLDEIVVRLLSRHEDLSGLELDGDRGPRDKVIHIQRRYERAREDTLERDGFHHQRLARQFECSLGSLLVDVFDLSGVDRSEDVRNVSKTSHKTSARHERSIGSHDVGATNSTG